MLITQQTKSNEAIAILGSTLKAERAKLQEVRTGITFDHEEFKASISSQNSKLQEDLAMEKPIIDNSKEEELDEKELKRRKAREAELDENQRIVPKDEAMEKAEREAQKYEPVILYLKLMIISYIQEMGNMDVEIATMLRRKPSAVPKEAPEGFEKLKLRKFCKES
ncbi:unnamed protein product [Lactuca saligna]|uniref:Uncharacterized protein n=1 Tax=Lactuca saligna TaxID=75948 RepID=A0AA35YV32_LACSI|nr:unnamed protein product [Lactuca saligna]